VWTAISSMPPDKTSGPNGFSGQFYQVAWLIIRLNIMNALDVFWCHGMCNLHDVNEALMVLLKSAAMINLKQYRPISLIHSIGKLLSKLLSNRLAPRLLELVHSS
jgi:hypothetical protein